MRSLLGEEGVELGKELVPRRFFGAEQVIRAVQGNELAPANQLGEHRRLLERHLDLVAGGAPPTSYSRSEPQ